MKKLLTLLLASTLLLSACAITDKEKDPKTESKPSKSETVKVGPNTIDGLAHKEVSIPSGPPADTKKPDKPAPAPKPQPGQPELKPPADKPAKKPSAPPTGMTAAQYKALLKQRKADEAAVKKNQDKTLKQMQEKHKKERDQRLKELKERAEKQRPGKPVTDPDDKSLTLAKVEKILKDNDVKVRRVNGKAKAKVGTIHLEGGVIILKPRVGMPASLKGSPNNPHVEGCNAEGLLGPVKAETAKAVEDALKKACK